MGAVVATRRGQGRPRPIATQRRSVGSGTELSTRSDGRRFLNRQRLAHLPDLNLAALYCDRLVLLKAGRMFCQGTPEQVLTYTNIKAVYETEVYIGLNDLTGKVQILPLDADTRRQLGQGDGNRR